MDDGTSSLGSRDWELHDGVLNTLIGCHLGIQHLKRQNIMTKHEYTFWRPTSLLWERITLSKNSDWRMIVINRNQINELQFDKSYVKIQHHLTYRLRTQRSLVVRIKWQSMKSLNFNLPLTRTFNFCINSGWINFYPLRKINSSTPEQRSVDIFPESREL